MNALKKILGAVWIVLGPVIILFLIYQAIEKVAASTSGIDRMNTSLQWGIIILIFIPICAGLVIFGLYSFKGEYDRLPKSSDDLK
ncbi:MAG TPA: hypothetical protein VGN64_15770 [Dyadobacter sp.]|jgi:hypothetical protein|nr:hypothetical protein [Dyadobacter sp.]